jgi:hypothetical protein
MDISSGADSMTTIDLDALKRLAVECQDVEVDETEWYEPQAFFFLVPERDRKFIATASPSVILDLIARIERAERTWRDREPPHCATCDCEVPNG